MLQRWKEDIFFDDNNKPYIQHVTNNAGAWVMADDAEAAIEQLKTDCARKNKILRELVGKAAQGLITGDCLIFDWHRFVARVQQELEEE